MKAHTYLNLPGTTEQAFRFYAKALGKPLTEIHRFKDAPMGDAKLPKEDLDKVMHVGLHVGPNHMIMGTDALASLGQQVVLGNHASISLHPDSRAEADRVFKALAEGGTVEMPLADQFWGDYFGSLKDKFGVQWMVNYSPPKP